MACATASHSGTARQAAATVGRPLPGPADSDRGPGPAGGAAAARPPSPEHGRPTDSDSDRVGLARLGPSPTAESPPTVTVGALPSAGGQGHWQTHGPRPRQALPGRPGAVLGRVPS
jgi:hypothetical protein